MVSFDIPICSKPIFSRSYVCVPKREKWSQYLSIIHLRCTSFLFFCRVWLLSMSNETFVFPSQVLAVHTFKIHRERLAAHIEAHLNVTFIHGSLCILHTHCWMQQRVGRKRWDGVEEAIRQWCSNPFPKVKGTIYWRKADLSSFLFPDSCCYAFNSIGLGDYVCALYIFIDPYNSYYIFAGERRTQNVQPANCIAFFLFILLSQTNTPSNELNRQQLNTWNFSTCDTTTDRTCINNQPKKKKNKQKNKKKTTQYRNKSDKNNKTEYLHILCYSIEQNSLSIYRVLRIESINYTQKDLPLFGCHSPQTHTQTGRHSLIYVVWSYTCT
jgi:hypothetical protein